MSSDSAGPSASWQLTHVVAQGCTPCVCALQRILSINTVKCVVHRVGCHSMACTGGQCA